jgi:hypothetical protein
MSGYQLNKDYAIEGSGSVGNRITETGAYSGTIIFARELVAKTGATGIRIKFKSVDGAEANMLDLYTHNASGQEIYGLKQVNALMTCAETRSLTPAPATVEEYDFESGGNVNIQTQVFQELNNKPIGLVLQKELYTKNNGDDGDRITFFAPFNPTNQKMAAEVLGNKPAKSLEQIMEKIKDKDKRSKQQNTQGGYQQNSQQQSSQSAYDFGDDSIPF